MSNSRRLLSRRLLLSGAGITMGAGMTGCAYYGFSAPKASTQPDQRGALASSDDMAMLDDVERRTFRFFWETTNPRNGLMPDNWPNPDFCSIASVGFGLSAYVIGVSRGYVSLKDAAERTLITLKTFWNGPQGEATSGIMGYKGFFYHFLDMETGLRFKNNELSSIDTAIFLCGALTCAAFFDQQDDTESAIRRHAIALYERVDWTFLERPNGLISMGWHPEKGMQGHDQNGLITRNWDRYNEGMMIYLLAMASPTYKAGNWAQWSESLSGTWGANFGREHLGFAPLFGHQYSHAWFDFRDIADGFMRGHNSDYFKNSREATLAQRNYAIANPSGFKGYSAEIWGLTASRGPSDIMANYNGKAVQFHTYAARGPLSGDGEGVDDGTIAPTGGIGSIPFAPEVSVPLVRSLITTYGRDIYDKYGFYDAFNPSYPATASTQTGWIRPKAGWVSKEYLGIDQGPIIMGIENYRSGLIWDLFNRSAVTGPIIKRGFKAAGFTAVGPKGAWLG